MALHIKKSNPFLFYPFALVGVLLVSFVPPLLVLGWGCWGTTYWLDTTSVSMAMDGLGFYVAALMLRRFERFPQRNPVAFILPISFSVFGVVLTLVLILRAAYSVKLILIGLLLTILLLAFQHRFSRRSRQLNLFTVPVGEGNQFKNSDHYTFTRLDKPLLPEGEVAGVVADMQSGLMTEDWQRFLSQCALRRIPVYNAMQLQESITGKVNVRHLIENDFGDLSPSLFHQNLKRLLDVLFLLLVSPVTIPLIAAITLWVVFDSPGGAFFIQRRMGFNGEWFNVVKFRSMTVNHGGEAFTEEGESHRITRVGMVIRKYRLDELPQFWNVLKGEMSLIGPRPESETLANWYDREVPFFLYRHVVRPGISGWAQVMHGYAAGVGDMKEKLEYDFYYIKHFSLWLDLLIWYKTIRTVLTGFGSR